MSVRLFTPSHAGRLYWTLVQLVLPGWGPSLRRLDLIFAMKPPIKLALGNRRAKRFPIRPEVVPPLLHGADRKPWQLSKADFQKTNRSPSDGPNLLGVGLLFPETVEQP